MEQFHNPGLPQSSHDPVLVVLAVTVCVLQVATLGAVLYALARFHRFLATHQLWSDVADKALTSLPAVFEGASRLLVGLQELTGVVSRAGGIVRLLGKDQKEK